MEEPKKDQETPNIIDEIIDMETKVLDLWTKITKNENCNMRWANIAKTDIEKGFMAFARALVEP